MTNDAQPAESSPAPSTPAAPVDLGALSAEERTEWRLSGKVPAPSDATPASPDPESSPAEIDTAEPVEQVASTDASPSPASEPGPPKKSKADTRFQELLKERATERDRADRLERELAALRAKQTQPDVPAVSSPASAAEFPNYDVWAETHPDQSYEDYLLGKFKHVQAQEQTASQQREAAEQFTRTAAERVEAFSGRYREALAADETLPTRINPRLYDLKTVDACLQAGERVTAANAIAQEIVESPQAVKLLLHLSEHPDEFARIASLNPAGVIRAMAKLESQLDTPVVPPPKTQTSAPAVTTVLGSRPAVPGDALKSAVQSGDFTRYREAANAREMATK